MRLPTLVYLSLAGVSFAYGAMHLVEVARGGIADGLSVAGILDGRDQARLEKAYDGTIPHKDMAADVLGSVRLALFGEGLKGVVVGNDGWLFTDEEFRVARPEHVERALGYVREVSGRLRGEGIDLVVALVPAKADVAAAELGSHRMPPEAEGRYEHVRAELAKDGVRAPDLRAAMRAVGPDAFVRTDTHWSPDGARAAAKAVAGEIGASPGDWTLRPVRQVEVSGDLEKFRRAPFAPASLRPASSPVEVFEAVPGEPKDEDAAVDLFGAAPVPVALVGTSYSASPDWSFAEMLKYETGGDVLNMAEIGKGPFAPMRTFLGGLSSMEARPDTVVWEIPVRYLALPETDVPEASDLVADGRHEGDRS